MGRANTDLERDAGAFADDIADLLESTVVDHAPIRPKVSRDRVVVSAYNPEGDRTAIALNVRGTPRFDLRLTAWCIWDSSGTYLAVDESDFNVALYRQGEPIVRFHYQRSRSWADAHIHVHAESSALAYGIADQGLTKPPKTQKLHLPVGGRRFRPCLEDMIEFLVHELGVDHKPGWQRRVDDGRQRWRDMQLAASLRDMIRADPDNAPDRLRRKIDEIVASLHQP